MLKIQVCYTNRNMYRLRWH